MILGRGATFVLRDKPDMLCVLFVGPQQARVRQAMRLHGLDRQAAEHQLDVNDETRLICVRRHYSRHPEEPTHYHLVIDYTAIDLNHVVDLVAHASTAVSAPLPGSREGRGDRTRGTA